MLGEEVHACAQSIFEIKPCEGLDLVWNAGSAKDCGFTDLINFMRKAKTYSSKVHEGLLRGGSSIRALGDKAKTT
jgi:hypothetical protein